MLHIISYFPFSELQYGFDSEDGRRGQQGGSRPNVPERQGRVRSIDYNAGGHDVNGHANESGPKGILRASSELPGGRQNRAQDRKAQTPDPEKEKKRGKSPFKLVI